MYLGAASKYTQAQIDDWITRTAAQPADAFLMGTARTVGEFWERSGFTRTDLEALAIQGLEREDLAKLAASVNPPTGSTRPPATVTATSGPATREQVLYVFRNTPGANPQPDEAAISYYMSKGVAQLVADIAAIRKSNPALAAQIDAQRKAMGLPTATSATTITPSTTATGGTTALLLAAAAAYLLGS